MKRNRSRFLPTVLAITALALSAANPLTAAAAVADESRVTDALVTMFAAATTDDLAKFHSVATRDFYAFDNGKRFVGDELMQLIKTAHASGAVYEWHVTEPQVHVSGNTPLDCIRQSGIGAEC